ncbi:MAG: tRNA (adenosine(37)-N6)-dimethylallyltransferase MiaA [Bacteroidetes bacterium]|nr:tRNA (adenosine(37)-N6)-dimethylallyltransferase MiaA [Bacteroidota bacterium]
MTNASPTSPHHPHPTVFVIVGPTAVGKTAAAIRLALQLGTKIISADSRQCFRELNIGVAKPSPQELSAVPHYFIDSHSIQEEVNAAIFERLALQWTEEIFKTSPSVVMVGGTGLYIKAFTEGLDDIPPADESIRFHIQQQYEVQGIGWLQDEIKKYDPGFYEKGEILNPQRLMRALEVRLTTGQSILSFRSPEPKPRPFQIQTIGIGLPKEQLHERIHNRVDQMIKDGLLEEVRSLLPYREHNALQTVGYRELFEYLDGKCTLDTAITNIKTNTRQYAKRQLTWFRRNLSTRWIGPNDEFPLSPTP